MTHPSGRRLFSALVLLACAVFFGAWLTADLIAQDPKKPKKEEEEEATNKTPRKVAFDPDVFGDDGPSKPGGKGTQPITEGQALIETALRNTQNAELQKFYTGVKVPHDLLTVHGLGDEFRTVAIEPLSRYYLGDNPHLVNGSIEVRTYDAEWRRSREPVKYKSAQRIRPYEEIVLEEVDKFDKQSPDALRLSRGQALQAEETVLAAADSFHRDARDKGRRRGDEWQPVGQKLREALRDVRIKRLHLLTDAGKWDEAAVYARTLAAAYRDSASLEPFIAALVGMIQKGLSVQSSAREMETALKQFHQLEEMFPGSESIPAIVSGREQLAKLLRERNQQVQDSSVLRVGVRNLPTKENMVPGRFGGDSDLWAMELLYEGLVKLRMDPALGQRYVPALAGEAPRLVPLGREFRLARGAAWSDGRLVTITDVKQTLAAMREHEWVGRSQLWSKLVEDAEPGQDAARSGMSLRLSQGYLDPLSLMTFKLMSRERALGSGPYTLDDSVNDKKKVGFIANPLYGGREGKFGLPRIRKIQFVLLDDRPDDATKRALQEQDVDLVLDLNARQAKELSVMQKIAVRGPMKNRRVWFLALNNRQPEFMDKETAAPLRRALAHAIDRQTILAKYFGDDPRNKPYRSLNGPFPAGSWPCDPNPQHVPPELFNTNLARGEAAEALKKVGKSIELTVLYPRGDDNLKRALEDVCNSVNKHLQFGDKYILLRLDKEGLSPAELRKRVEGSHDYQVAYYHYDHPSEAYWLAPLFDMDDDAVDINGSNYLGYKDDSLQAQLVSVKNHRDFAEVQKGMRLVHQMLNESMPLVPLWQLDTYLAYSERLNFKDAAIDPLLIFNDVEQWELEKR